MKWRGQLLNSDETSSWKLERLVVGDGPLDGLVGRHVGVVVEPQSGLGAVEEK